MKGARYTFLMSLARVGEFARASFAPPRYLVPSPVGFDLSTSGVKAVRLSEHPHGLELARYAEVRLPSGAFVDGEIADAAAVSAAIAEAAAGIGAYSANATLPESKSYLFETNAAGTTKEEWRVVVEQRLDELVPLPPSETAFDLVGIGADQAGEKIVGVGYARRIVDQTLSAFDAARVSVRTLEGETFAMARSLVRVGDPSTILIIDIGKTTTKMAIVTLGIPRFAATFGIGGHALTLAVQKHFGVTEAEARRVKAEKGIVPAPGNEDYLAAMLSTVSAIRDELSRRLEYWQTKAAAGSHEPVARAIVAGGNASLRGLPEYLSGALNIPVSAGDVFTNLASRDAWIPELDYSESLAYATAIGLALRDTHLYA